MDDEIQFDIECCCVQDEQAGIQIDKSHAMFHHQMLYSYSPLPCACKLYGAELQAVLLQRDARFNYILLLLTPYPHTLSTP